MRLNPKPRESLQPLPAFPVYHPPGAGGLRPGVNLDNTCELLDLMDPPDALARLYRT